MGFEEYAEASLRELKEQTRLLRKLCAALAINPAKATERRAQVQQLPGGFAAAQQRRKRKAG